MLAVNLICRVENFKPVAFNTCNWVNGTAVIPIKNNSGRNIDGKMMHGVEDSNDTINSVGATWFDAG